MKTTIIAAVVTLPWLAALALAQRMEPPSKVEVRSSTERAAYDKAMCVYRGLTEAGEVFSPASGAMKPTPEAQALAKRESALWAVKSRAAVRACLTEKDVYDLGRYSLMEDIAFADGTSCRLSKAPAARFERTPNHNDGDIVNGAALWEAVPERGSVGGLLFFKGQSEAREQFRNMMDRVSVCRVIVDEFGPNGDRFPGMVRGQ